VNNRASLVVVLALLIAGAAWYARRASEQEEAARNASIRGAREQAAAMGEAQRSFARALEKEGYHVDARQTVRTDPEERRATVYLGPANGPAECVHAWDPVKRECVLDAPQPAPAK
jgi:hypothetical protein